MKSVIKTKDERYSILVEVDSGEQFMLYYNIANPYFYEHFAGLEEAVDMKLSIEGAESFVDMRDSIKPFLDVLDIHFDGIFGKGAARKVFSYSGTAREDFENIMIEVRKGMEKFYDGIKKEQAKEKKAIAEKAKQDSANFVSNL